ncbi:B3 domain-containing protein REM20 [Raphanus sativus]|nr:B3 domain-containing protein REM20 [Raphanus sativus]
MDENEDDVLPRFFKVFFSETASESMGIPMSFNEHLEDPLPQKAKLQGTGGGVWTVSFTKIRECAYFTSGWSKFAEEHELKDETRAVVETVEVSDDDSDGSEEEEDSSADDDSDVSSNVTVSDDDAGLSSMEVTGNPCFTTKLKQRIYELLIPANVVNEHGLTFGDSIKYIDAEGVMKGERGKMPDGRVCLKGWNRVCRRNRVREQDTVHCEMLHVRKKVHSIKVTVTRG